MAKKSCHCKKSGECEECPEWIFTFADLVMLMMGFFVMLYVLKPAPGNPGTSGEKASLPPELVKEIREAFGGRLDPNNPMDAEMLEKLKRLRLHGEGNTGRIRNEQQGTEGTDPEVTTVRQGKQTIVGGRLSFEKSDAKLSPEVTTVLNQIIDQIKGHRTIVLVKGHTSLDDLTDKAAPEEKMDLSIRRAQAVADYLTKHGVEGEIIRVQGCSTFEPIIQRDYQIGAQATNRRVEVEATSTLVQERQDLSAKKQVVQ
jgi:flagellar motor protein MotB